MPCSLELIQCGASLSYIVYRCLTIRVRAVFRYALVARFDAKQRVLFTDSATTISAMAGPVYVLRLMVVLCTWHIIENAFRHIRRPEQASRRICRPHQKTGENNVLDHSYNREM